ncbi:hypothetical protein AAHB43_15240 [Staphylococcus pseudintermedius]
MNLKIDMVKAKMKRIVDEALVAGGLVIVQKSKVTLKALKTQELVKLK